MTLCISTLVPLYWVFQLKQESRFATSMLSENPSNEGSEITLKIPIALPYATDWDQPKESEGLFQHGDKFYTLVSKTYQSDTLYVTAIENSNARDIFTMLSEHFEQSPEPADAPQDQGQWLAKLLQNMYFTQDYYRASFSDLFSLTGKSVNYKPHNILYSSPYLGIITPPPDFVC